MIKKDIFNKTVEIRNQLESLFDQAKDNDMIYDAEPDICCLNSFDEILSQMEMSLEEYDEDDECTNAEKYGYDEDTCRANVEECGGL